MTERRSAVRVGSERGVQTRDPVRLQAVAAPVVQSAPQSRSVLGVELDRPTRSHRLELHADRLRVGRKGEFLEEDVAVVPRDLDDLARDVDPHPIEPTRFHAGRAYSGAAA